MNEILDLLDEVLKCNPSKDIRNLVYQISLIVDKGDESDKG